MQCFPTKDLVTLDAENWNSIVGGVVCDAVVPMIAASLSFEPKKLCFFNPPRMSQKSYFLVLEA